MTWLRQIVFSVSIAAASAAASTPLAVSAASTSGSITAFSPGSGLAGAAFSLTYHWNRGGPGPCGTGATVVVHWNSQTGPLLASQQRSASCDNSFGNLHPPSGTQPGNYQVAVYQLAGYPAKNPPTIVTNSLAQHAYTVNAPPPPPPSPTPTKPPPTHNPGPQPTATATTHTSPTTNPVPGPVAVASVPGTTAAAAPTSEQPPPANNSPATAAIPAACKGAACPRTGAVATTPGLVARIQSALGSSPFWLFAIVLAVVAGIVFLALRRNQAPAVAAAVVQPPPLDPRALDPVVGDPNDREIYVPPVPEALPRGNDPVELKRPGRRTPVPPQTAKTMALTVDVPTAPAQDTEAILPHELFPASADKTVLMKPAQSDDGLPAMVPPPPK